MTLRILIDILFHIHDTKSRKVIIKKIFDLTVEDEQLTEHLTSPQYSNLLETITSKIEKLSNQYMGFEVYVEKIAKLRKKAELRKEELELYPKNLERYHKELGFYDSIRVWVW